MTTIIRPSTDNFKSYYRSPLQGRILLIFKKLSGTDLTFDIILEKTEYMPGQMVRGSIELMTKKGSEARRSCYLQKAKSLLK
jgi:hypothetical protein